MSRIWRKAKYPISEGRRVAIGHRAPRPRRSRERSTSGLVAPTATGRRRSNPSRGARCGCSASAASALTVEIALCKFLTHSQCRRQRGRIMDRPAPGGRPGPRPAPSAAPSPWAERYGNARRGSRPDRRKQQRSACQLCIVLHALRQGGGTWSRGRTSRTEDLSNIYEGESANR